MGRIVFGIMFVLALAPALWADDPPKGQSGTPAQQYQAIVKEWNTANQEFLEEYKKTPPAERAKLLKEKRPQPSKFAERMLELAEKNPKDQAGLDATVWVIQFAGNGPEANKAADQLTQRDFAKTCTSRQLQTLAQRLATVPNPTAAKILREIVKNGKDHDAQGQACYALANNLKAQAPRSRGNSEQLLKEAESFYERAMKEFGDVRGFDGPLGERAEAALKRIRGTRVGGEVLDITGEDLDGKNFKLSDYRGKVVLLDFWGHW